MQLEAEFTSEPFQGEGPPPDHAVRACETAREAGLDADFGPLGTLVHGEADTILDAIPAIARAALASGATRVTLQLRQLDGVTPPAPSVELNSALTRLLAEVERELGGELATLDRPAKQRAVRLLKERGAFTQRKAVPTVADALGVTRFTVYNYLNRDA
ncbi:helix-turn-helix domain-containing protein [Amycolatopsis sp. H20-H5]|uniref:helix-turn-helix domain-containing protein n=1 Tax=Amycolatopsis sp. H20-H5 TaxID=3046309 RepID=UPI002DB85DF9|nr:helix-turn-helix domain-containing protein [Amycolatopsis sp. H20-H5]MEC3976357.1 helix-turn-helix domain-containing protein [Amycolatopsis sp. H20-H5]